MTDTSKMRRQLFAGMTRLIARAEQGTRSLSRVLHELRYQSFVRLMHQARPNDIFIVSYPKAGTTVMQMMLHNIVGDGRTDFTHIDAVVPWFEQRFLQTSRTYDGLPSPRAFKTHLTFAKLPRGASYIYLLRNPKDSCVSYYFHTMSAGRYDLAMHKFVAQFLDGSVASGSWFEHLKACSQPRRGERVLLVNYDDIANDLGAVVDQVSEFCGRELDQEQRARVIERCSFGFMKRHNEKFDPRNATGVRTTPKTDFIRKGVPGDWVNHLPPALASAIDQQVEATLRTLEPYLTKRHVEIVRARPSRARGTLRITLGMTQQSRLLIRSEAEVVPWGIRIATNGQPLRVGDLVRLEISVTPDSEALAEEAEVVATNTSATVLRFPRIGKEYESRVRDVCARAERCLFSCEPNDGRVMATQ